MDTGNCQNRPGRSKPNSGDLRPHTASPVRKPASPTASPILTRRIRSSLSKTTEPAPVQPTPPSDRRPRETEERSVDTGPGMVVMHVRDEGRKGKDVVLFCFYFSFLFLLLTLLVSVCHPFYMLLCNFHLQCFLIAFNLFHIPPIPPSSPFCLFPYRSCSRVFPPARFYVRA